MSLRYRIELPIRWTKTVGDSVYHWPPIWPTNEDIDEFKNWCKKNVGANGWNYYGFYRKNPCEFRFKKSEDLLAFKLTFGLHNNSEVDLP